MDFLALEHFQKYCSHSAEEKERAVFLVFGFVSVQLQGFLNLRLRRSLAKTPKIFAPNGYSISSNAPGELTVGDYPDGPERPPRVVSQT